MVGALIEKIAAVAYVVFLVCLAWSGGTNIDGGDVSDDWVDASDVLALAAFAAVATFAGFAVGSRALVLGVAAVVVTAVSGYALDEFDNELAGYNWLLQLAFGSAWVTIGLWIRHHRVRRV